MGTIVPTSVGWTATCVSLVSNLTTGFVDVNGLPMVKRDNNTWGIDITTCRSHCNASIIPLDFNFQNFATSFTNYLLPWLALTAQLPYETGSPWSNIMSLCMAVGSPALITYSLSLTILNRSWVRQQFDSLFSRARGQSVHQRFPGYADRVRAAQYLLQEAQQVPMRASQDSGWLSSLVVVGDNQKWWQRMRDRLNNTRRGVTFSLTAQIVMAAIAWLFTVISAFIGFLGDMVVALQISAGSLWIWMIPVICGWITVGTQSRPGSIAEVLRADKAHRALEPPVGVASRYTESGEQRAITARSGLTPEPHRVHQTVVGGFQVPPLANVRIPSWFGCDISGDERRRGPIYNYSRVFTWWQCATSVDEAMEATMTSIEAGGTCQTRQPWDTARKAEDNLAGDSLQTARYCGLTTNSIHAYPKWSDIPADVWKRMITAALMGIFVQWGTTGPAIVIAYTTPVQGFGCRSGAYTLYGSLGVAAWFFLTISMLLSHGAMLRYQEVHANNPMIDLRKNVNGQNQYKRTWPHTFICAAAVVTRYLGKTIAVCNAIWILLSSLFEYIGGFDNCWCKGDVLGLGDRGWVVLYKTAGELAQAAQTPWATGVATSILVCVFSFSFFWLGCRRTGED